eukprot:207393_1
MDRQNIRKNNWNKYCELQPQSIQPIHVFPRNNKHIKIVSLGSGSSGKLTILKQLKYIYKESYTEEEKHNINDENKAVIRRNCVTGILCLLKKSQELYDLSPQMFAKCLVNLNDNIIADIKIITSYRSESFDDILDYNAVQKLGKAINRIWHLDSIYETWKQHLCGMYCFVVNMDYFFNKVTDIMNEKYTPSKQDYLKMRLRTTGLTEFQWNVRGYNFQFVHTGGQRNERLKWIHCFEGVSCVLFVIGLDHFCKALFEDEQKNALLEAIELFEEISKLKYLRYSKMAVILARTDVFDRCLKYNSMKCCFGDYYNEIDVVKDNLDSWIRMIGFIWSDINIEIPIAVIRLLLFYCGHLWKWDPFMVHGLQFIKDIVLRIRPDAMVYELCCMNTDEVKDVMEDIQKRLIESMSINLPYFN